MKKIWQRRRRWRPTTALHGLETNKSRPWDPITGLGQKPAGLDLRQRRSRLRPLIGLWDVNPGVVGSATGQPSSLLVSGRPSGHSRSRVARPWGPNGARVSLCRGSNRCRRPCVFSRMEKTKIANGCLRMGQTGLVKWACQILKYLVFFKLF